MNCNEKCRCRPTLESPSIRTLSLPSKGMRHCRSSLRCQWGMVFVSTKQTAPLLLLQASSFGTMQNTVKDQQETHYIDLKTIYEGPFVTSFSEASLCRHLVFVSHRCCDGGLVLWHGMFEEFYECSFVYMQVPLYFYSFVVQGKRLENHKD